MTDLCNKCVYVALEHRRIKCVLLDQTGGI